MAGYRKMAQRMFLNRNILWNMALKELKAKYTGSLLGIWWAIITPLLTMLVIAFVFTKVMKINIENFPLFSLSGIIPWFFFSVSLSESVTSLIRNAQLLRQFTFPAEFLPISCVLANFINFIFGFIFIIPIFIIFKVKVISVLVFLPQVLIMHLLFTLGLALLLSCINVLFRDLEHLLGTVLMFWFWVTPVFYSTAMIPTSYRWICMLNPMSTYIAMYRNILFEARPPPGAGEFFSPLFIGTGVFLTGYAVFIKYKPLIIKRI